MVGSSTTSTCTHACGHALHWVQLYRHSCTGKIGGFAGFYCVIDLYPGRLGTAFSLETYLMKVVLQSGRDLQLSSGMLRPGPMTVTSIFIILPIVK
eukprot:SAG11_NODE_2484_length_3303_cov_14.286517_4_plen_96_part_00